MRVLMTTDCVGGVFRYAIELSSWLTAHGVTVCLATMGRPLSNEQRRSLSHADVSVEESSYRLEWMEEPWDDVAAAGAWLLRIARAFRPDVVHLNEYSFAALPFRAPALVVAHSSVTTWWHAVCDEAPPPRYDRYRNQITRGLARASCVVAPSQAMLSELLKHDAGGRVLPARVIENGICVPDAPTATKQPFVFSAGRLWDRAKNLELLAQAAPSLDWPIYVAGDARLEGNRAPQLHGLRCLGLLAPEALSNWLSRAAIYASPALYEPFGLAILEAASAGCALVLGDIPSLRELWSGAACFADPRDPLAFASELGQLTVDAEARQLLGQRARERSIRFSVERMAGAYLGLYAELIANRVQTPAAARVAS